MSVSLRAAPEPQIRGVLEQAEFGSSAHPDGCAKLECGCSVLVCTRDRPALLERFLGSLALQSPTPHSLIIVDASGDQRSREVLERHPRRDELAGWVRYLRVDASLTGVTRQRNLGLRLTTTDLVAVFDDDIMLEPGCIAALEQAHRADPGLAGVGAFIANEQDPPSLIWRLRRLLSSCRRWLRAATSTRASRPRGASPRRRRRRFRVTGSLAVQSCGEPRSPGPMDSRKISTATASATISNSACELDGAGARPSPATPACCICSSPGGRPDSERLGYESLRNWWYIHSVGSGDGLGARCWFAYAVVVETALQSVSLLRPTRAREAWRYLRGASRFVREHWRAPGLV